ncbi:MAG: hypothetical protein QF894_12365 [Alphaproteobacteria bacterium]|nr:hypothetical protein [Alphaproteobacteria bacterium]
MAAMPALAAEELPPEEAARCAHLQHQLEGLEDRLDSHDDRVARARRLIEQQGALLENMKEKLDASDRESVLAYNAKVGQYGLTIERYNGELLPELTRRRDAFNAKAREYNKDCAGKEMR